MLNHAWGIVCNEIERWMESSESNLLNMSSGKIELLLLEPGTKLRPYAGTTNSMLRMRCPLHATLSLKDSFVRVGGRKVQTTALNNSNSCLVYRPECEHQEYLDHKIESNDIALIVDFTSSFSFAQSVRNAPTEL